RRFLSTPATRLCRQIRPQNRLHPCASYAVCATLEHGCGFTISSVVGGFGTAHFRGLTPVYAILTLMIELLTRDSGAAPLRRPEDGSRACCSVGPLLRASRTVLVTRNRV